ncbi:hypothetical protein GCK72_003630 [Caenorhabditis remanei]|uniref:Death domain-containing protein n=1 Tax=Caenorhabditis remanei TaxID=31234 RepID=A0A6A5H928_CAERE|nr:hypothetical protein GCK72_003630 [Caenorhabditis remanei]KAF1763685.1 hypothetical protein GCK72_003630 [Caenorhabditis remanei]
MDEAIATRNFDDLRELFKAEKKLVKDDEFVLIKIDGLLKKRGYKIIELPSEQKEDFARQHYHFVMSCMKLGYCSKSTPILTLQDLLEMSSIEECKQLFGLVEENMNEFKQPGFIETYQNTILRLCNDLLRRLSRTAETSFCGRIMFFLSRFLPLTEKSGVNFMGHFNTLNITNYEETETTAESLLTAASSRRPTPVDGEEMETGEIEEDQAKEINVTSEMYRQFWSLQKFMSNPNLLYEKDKFAMFKKDLSAVLSLMTANKLEKLNQEEESEYTENKQKKVSNDVFFTKYLTSPKLLALQLNDSSFRRYFLIQTIIIFQYLNAESRFKPPAKKMVLNEEQAKYVTDHEDKCYRLLSDTMPRGAVFVAGLKKIIQREQEWNTWKNSNCPDLSEKADKGAMQMYKKRQRIPFNPQSLDLGTPELTKLWTNEPDVLQACKSDKRKFIPTLANFIRDPLDEMDPEQQVEEQYKSINDISFQWRAARLLMHKSPGYVSRTDIKSEPNSNMRDYLERNIYNAAKTIDEFKDGIAERERKEAESRKEKEAEARRKVEESLKRKLDTKTVKKTDVVSSPNPYTDSPLSDENLHKLAQDLSKFSRKLAKLLGVDDAKVQKSMTNSEEKEFCFRILKEWAEKNSRSGRSLLNLLIGDLDLIEVAQVTMKKIHESNA